MRGSSNSGGEPAGGELGADWVIDERKIPVVARLPVAATCWVKADDQGRSRFVVTTDSVKADQASPIRPTANANGCSLSKRAAWVLWSEKQRLAKGR